MGSIYRRSGCNSAHSHIKRITRSNKKRFFFVQPDWDSLGEGQGDGVVCRSPTLSYGKRSKATRRETYAWPNDRVDACKGYLLCGWMAFGRWAAVFEVNAGYLGDDLTKWNDIYQWINQMSSFGRLCLFMPGSLDWSQAASSSRKRDRSCCEKGRKRMPLQQLLDVLQSHNRTTWI